MRQARARTWWLLTSQILIESNVPVLLIRESRDQNSAIGTFDFADLNAYLLLATGFTQPEPESIPAYEELARKARLNLTIPLKDVKDLGRKEPMTTLPASASAMTAIETFGGGVHRVLVVDPELGGAVRGLFSQFRLVKFLWENARTFPVIEQLHTQALQDLRIGSRDVVSIKYVLWFDLRVPSNCYLAVINHCMKPCRSWTTTGCRPWPWWTIIPTWWAISPRQMSR